MVSTWFVYGSRARSCYVCVKLCSFYVYALLNCVHALFVYVQVLLVFVHLLFILVDI